MINPLLNDGRLDILQQALNGLARRQQAIAGNIANVDTPGYQRQDVNFEADLRSSLNARPGLSLATSDPGHIALSSSNGRMLRAATGNTSGPSPSTRNDGNNVDIDYEMAQLSETTLRYELLSQATTSRFTTLRDIATHLV
jgi:flagellar basal-body rod protein FlgB